MQAASEVLQDLQTKYVDLLLLHYPDCWPQICGGVAPEGNWRDRCVPPGAACGAGWGGAAVGATLMGLGPHPAAALLYAHTTHVLPCFVCAV